MIRRFAGALLVALAALVLVSCGGGGAGGNEPPPTSSPSALSYVSPRIIAINTAMEAIRPTVTGGVASYSVSPTLPPRISLNAATGQISGTPTATAAPTIYTLTATNAGGSATFALELKVISLELDSGSITRVAAQSAPISPEVIVRPVYFDPGAMYAMASHAGGLFVAGVVVSSKATHNATDLTAINLK